MGETDSGIWVFFWWVGPCSVNFQCNFLLVGGAVFPPCCLAWGQTMIGVMKVKKTSFKRTYAHTVVFSAPDPTAGPWWLTLLLETPGHSQASLAQSLVRTLLFCPGSWRAQAFICALLESVSPVLWKFYNQIPLASKVKFPGISQSPCQIPRLRNLLWILELSLTVQELVWYNCSEICGLSVQGLYGGANGNLLQEGLCPRLHVPGLLQLEAVCLWQAACPRSAAARSTVPLAGHCRLMPLQETLKHSKACLAQSVWPLGPGGHKVLFEHLLSISGRYGVWL